MFTPYLFIHSLVRFVFMTFHRTLVIITFVCANQLFTLSRDICFMYYNLNVFLMPFNICLSYKYQMFKHFHTKSTLMHWLMTVLSLWRYLTIWGSMHRAQSWLYEMTFHKNSSSKPTHQLHSLSLYAIAGSILTPAWDPLSIRCVK